VAYSSDGDQLNLQLFPELPWDGHSPGALTRARKVLYSRQKPPGATRLCHDPEQLELWPIDQATLREGPGRFSAGAPLLLEHLLRRS